VHGECLGA